MKQRSLIFSFIMLCLVFLGSPMFLTIHLIPRANAQEPTPGAEIQMPEPSQAEPGRPNAAKGTVDGPASSNSEVNTQSQSGIKLESKSHGEMTEKDLINSRPTYYYDPTGKRDPFKPFKDFMENSKVVEVSKTTSKKEVEKTPLTSVPLDQISLVAVLWDVNTPRAMVSTSTGMYSIAKNTKIGTNNGYVALIREGEVVVIETFYDEGNTRKQAKVLELKK